MGGLNNVINVLRKSQSLASQGDSMARLFTKSFSPGELNSIIRTFSDIRKELSAIRAGKGVPTGSSLVNPAMAAGAAIGGEVGEALGDSAMATHGRVIGAALTRPFIARVAEAMTNEGGRKVVRFAVHMDPTGGPVFQNMVLGYLSTQQAQQRRMREPAPIPTAAPPPPPQPAPTPDQPKPPAPDPALEAVTH
jgi:hypothetical protein